MSHGGRRDRSGLAATIALFAAPDEPTCWGWETPTLTYEQEMARLTAAADEFAARLILRDFPYHVFTEFHQGRCAICGRRERLVLDHDHVTALVRGQLCHSCNVGEGKSDAQIFMQYRQKNPATILGYRKVYIDPFTGRPARPRPPETEEEKWVRARVVGDALGL